MVQPADQAAVHTTALDPDRKGSIMKLEGQHLAAASLVGAVALFLIVKNFRILLKLGIFLYHFLLLAACLR